MRKDSPAPARLPSRIPRIRTRKKESETRKSLRSKIHKSKSKNQKSQHKVTIIFISVDLGVDSPLPHYLSLFLCSITTVLAVPMVRYVGLIASLAALVRTDAFSSCTSRTRVNPSSTGLAATRRSLLEHASKSLGIGAASLLLDLPSAVAREVTDVTSGNIPDLPIDAQRSYMQYRFPLQLAADFYIFDLQTMVADTGEVFLVFLFCLILF